MKRCLPSFTISIGGGTNNCDVTVQAIGDMGNARVPSTWSTYDAGTQPTTPAACPTGAGAAVTGNTQGSLTAKIEEALESYVYSGNVVLPASVTFPSAGLAQISTATTAGFALSGTLTYAITAVSAG